MDTVTILAYNILSCMLHPEDCSGLIAPSRLAQIKRFRPDDQRRSLCGDLLIRKAFLEHARAPALPLQYDVSENGKPFLSNFPDFHFNVSHSGNWVLCATGTLPMGIDIQQERPIKSALLRRALSSQEQLFLKTVPTAKQLSTFFDMWCLKEAYCKATGLGLRIPLPSFTVTLQPTTVSDSSYRVNLIPFPAENYHVGLCVKDFSVPKFELHIVTGIK